MVLGPWGRGHGAAAMGADAMGKGSNALSPKWNRVAAGKRKRGISSVERFGLGLAGAGRCERDAHMPRLAEGQRKERD